MDLLIALQEEYARLTKSITPENIEEHRSIVFKLGMNSAAQERIKNTSY